MMTTTTTSHSQKITAPLEIREIKITASNGQLQSKIKEEEQQQQNAGKVFLTAATAGLVDFPGITAESAKAASEALQDNHDKHHIIFNELGYHNHVVHCILALYDLGASPELIRHHYAREKLYQNPHTDVQENVIADLTDESKWGKYLGVEKHYSDFLAFFKKEIDEIGWEETLNKRLFSRTEQAEDLFARFYDGLYHPFIHIGYGVEFGLPAIIAEGLAQAAIHQSWSREFFEKCERAEESADSKSSSAGKTLSELLSEIEKDEKVSRVNGMDELDKGRALLKNATAGDQMVKYVTQFKVSEESIEEKTAEVINASAQIFGGALRKDKKILFDFFLLHCNNSCIFLSTFLHQPWLSTANKARIIRRKAYFDLFTYAAYAAPPLHLDEIKNYTPRAAPSATESSNAGWCDTVSRSLLCEDDGHTAKLIRSLVHAEKVCRKYEDREGFVVNGDMWMKLARMAVDSVEGEGKGFKWIINTGFDEAWKDVVGRN